MAALPALGAESEEEKKAKDAEEIVVWGDRDAIDVTQEIVVWGDRFARWDDTRWFIETEVSQPWPLLLGQDDNNEFQTQEYRVRSIFACEKQYKLGRKRYEVACAIEDIGLIANVADRRPTDKRLAIAQQVLDEIDSKLTGANMQLRVGDDGRVLGIELEGIPTQNRRQNRIQQTLTQVMARLIVGYDLEMQQDNQLHEGVWVEYNTKLLYLSTDAVGSNYVKHYLNKYRDHIVVQSIGRGISTVTLTPSSYSGFDQRVQQGPARFDVHIDGVSLFSPEDGYLVERVWAIKGESNPTGTFIQLKYSHTGSVRELGKRDRPNCGKTRVVNGRRQHHPGLPEWPEATDKR